MEIIECRGEGRRGHDRARRSLLRSACGRTGHPARLRAGASQYRVRITSMCIRLPSRPGDRGVEIPFILFTYYNPALQFGLGAILEAA